jgi:hypothetical protein
MATWAELQAHARMRYRLNNDDIEGFSVEFTFEDGRTQLVGVHAFGAFEQAFIELRTYVCGEAEIPPRVALQKNDDFVLGGLAIDQDGDYCLLYSTPIRSMSLMDFDLVIRALARTADTLEKDYANAGA